MNKSCITIIIITLALILQAAHGILAIEVNLELKNPWVKIDKHLKKCTDSNDFDLNLQCAEKFLEEKRLSEPKLGQSNKKLFEALELMLSLRNLLNENNDYNCGLEGLNILQPLKKEIMPGSLFHNLSRTKDILIDISTRHGELCRSRYYKMLHDKLEIIKDRTSQVEYFMKPLIENYFSGPKEQKISEKSFHKYIISNNLGDVISHQNVIDSFSICKARYQNEMSNKDVLDKCIINPCENYISKVLGIFVFASFDYLEPNDEKTPESYEFFKHWAQSKICEAFIERGDSELVHFDPNSINLKTIY